MMTEAGARNGGKKQEKGRLLPALLNPTAETLFTDLIYFQNVSPIKYLH
ncbi:hypothetical protein [Yokenella regensburgei]|jgi:hypothetical protein|nr:hypothetical protein [Yokenella regensburgei]EHM45931.1 hypothetical protein HMPREF0880_03979 [Yokenella regensburgei ATCC 43003]QIU89293.1 hypothetical protein HEC60_08035 [Yokenella regensburgei]